MSISPLRFTVSALLAGTLLAGPAATAALVEYSGGGRIVETSGRAPDALSADADAFVSFAFVFDPGREPIVATDTAATYAAFSAVAMFGDGAVITLSQATMMVVREPSDGDYIYLLQGTTPQGWVLSYYVESNDSEFVPSLALPRQRPVPHDDYWAAVLVRDAAATWSAYSDATALFAIHYTPDPEPVRPQIEVQPQDVVAAWGSAATFSVRGVGAGELTYQWERDGVALRGATEPTLRINRVLPPHAGSYRVVVSNAAGRITSDSAELSILRPPVIVKQPVALTAEVGRSATLSLNAYSPEPITYQWFRDGVSIPGANHTTLRIPQAQLSDGGRYHAVATNSQGSATSREVVVTVR
jgi:hypothetical protein